jgi:hypothetical protein
MDVIMTPQEYANQELEKFQSGPEGVTEKRICELLSVLNDLKFLAPTRNGAKALRENHIQMVTALRKLHDLTMDSEPTLIDFTGLLRSKSA